MAIEAILTDMDGTLIDTEHANAASYCEAISAYGVDISTEYFCQEYGGMSWKQFLPIILPDHEMDVYSAIAADKKDIYRNNMAKTSVFEPVHQFLLNFYGLAKLGIVTTASRQAVNNLLQYHNLGGIFDVIVSGDDVKNAKPHPEPYLLAAAKLDVDIKKCIILEDSLIGVESGTASGATVFVVKHAK
ncbi:HAD family hydrolase [Yersinia sp. 2466 StPb PI]|uniref:HAD family hydrolase n=1 Tax=Yersinia sp. 2466 StPb PI TaxID=3061648 RepID=UPI00355C6E80